MTELLIGIPTYKDYQRIEYLLSTIEQTDFDDISYKIVILDDGTKDSVIKETIKDIADEYGIDYIRHDENLGIPKSWNDLTRSNDSEYVVLFNDDIGVIDPNWAKHLIYFLKNNENIGMVGFPLNQINPEIGLMKEIEYTEDSPGRCGAAVGCCFGFRREDYAKVGGFWDALVSFHEESSFGFELAKMGHYSYMLPYPRMEHRGSQTFAKNKELSIRKIEAHVLSKKEYLEIVGPHIIDWPYIGKFYSVTPEGDIYDDTQGEYVGRMEYSRAMFAKKWGSIKEYKNPMNIPHKKYVDTAPKQLIKWLNKDLKKCQKVI